MYSIHVKSITLNIYSSIFIKLPKSPVQCFVHVFLFPFIKSITSNLYSSILMKLHLPVISFVSNLLCRVIWEHQTIMPWLIFPSHLLCHLSKNVNPCHISVTVESEMQEDKFNRILIRATGLTSVLHVYHPLHWCHIKRYKFTL